MSRLELVPGAPRAIVLGAGHDGSGCTVTATLLALAAYAGGARVLLVDQALKTPVLLQLLGLPGGAAAPAAHLIDDRFTVVTTGPWSEGLPASVPLAMERAPACDVAVVLGGARHATLVAAATLAAAIQPGADLVVLPREDRVGLAAGYAALKVMADRLPAARLHAILGRRPDARGTDAHVADALAGSALDGFTAVVAKCLGRTCRILPALPDDPALPPALAAGLPLAEVLAGSPLLEAAARCWSLLSTTPLHPPRAGLHRRAFAASPA